jgi:DNA (cytosine-5)-methyltransferase 1
MTDSPLPTLSKVKTTAQVMALDMYCCAGGATKGLQRAGFKVLGVDHKAQPRYCGDWFVEADCLSLTPAFVRQFDFAWASPPCQAHTSMKTMWNAKQHADLIPQTLDLLKRAGVPYVVENVVGAPLENAFMLCGTQFGLGIPEAELRRHRLFVTNTGLAFPRRCKHRKRYTIGVYGGGHGVSLHRHARGERCFTAEQQRKAMDMPWATVDEMSQAIPPAYSEFIARAFLAQRKQVAA